MNAPFPAPIGQPSGSTSAREQHLASASRFRDRLIGAGVLLDMGVEGAYGRSEAFDAATEGVDRLFVALSAGDGAEAMRFPPGFPRTSLEKAGYPKNFPNLVGTIHCFCGDAAGHRRILSCLDAGEDWTDQQQTSDLAMTPAACYPVYGAVAARGPVPVDGKRVDVIGWCFRQEPSPDPARMRMFRMHEQVFIGGEEAAQDFRAQWLDRARDAAGRLQLPHAVDDANDPFFGRTGQLMAASQRERALKQELLIPVGSDASPTACASVNYHVDGFGKTWGLRLPDGAPAHTACVGFGLERWALALFRHHGLDQRAWPVGVRATLGLA